MAFCKHKRVGDLWIPEMWDERTLDHRYLQGMLSENGLFWIVASQKPSQGN